VQLVDPSHCGFFLRMLQTQIPARCFQITLLPHGLMVFYFVLPAVIEFVYLPGLVISISGTHSGVFTSSSPSVFTLPNFS
jgi:hypothetical protein